MWLAAVMRGGLAQRQAEPIEENPLVLIGLSVAAEDQHEPVGDREVDAEYLDSGKLVEHGSRGEALRPGGGVWRTA